MSGARFLYITKDLEVIRIPIANGNIFKAVPKLKNQDVLSIELIYETNNRMPSKFIHIGFSRNTLDNEGKFDITNDITSEKARNLLSYGFSRTEFPDNDAPPLPFPLPRDIPNEFERDALLKYINEKLPSLYPTAAYTIFQSVSRLKELNQRDRESFKQSEKGRRFNEKYD